MVGGALVGGGGGLVGAKTHPQTQLEFPQSGPTSPSQQYWLLGFPLVFEAQSEGQLKQSSPASQIPLPLQIVVGKAVVGGAVVGVAVGGAVVGEDVGGAVVGVSVVGAAVGGAEVGAAVVGAGVGAAVVGDAVGGAEVGAAVVGAGVGATVVVRLWEALR